MIDRGGEKDEQEDVPQGSVRSLLRLELSKHESFEKVLSLVPQKVFGAIAQASSGQRCGCYMTGALTPPLSTCL